MFWYLRFSDKYQKMAELLYISNKLHSINNSLPASLSETVWTSSLALKYSNMGALASSLSSNIQTWTLALVIAVYNCFSSVLRTLCLFESNARGLGLLVSLKTSMKIEQNWYTCTTQVRHFLIDLRNNTYCNQFPQG